MLVKVATGANKASFVFFILKISVFGILLDSGFILIFSRVITDKNVDTWGSLYWHGLALMPAWWRNHIPDKVWVEIHYPFLNDTGATVELLPRLSGWNELKIIDTKPQKHESEDIAHISWGMMLISCVGVSYQPSFLQHPQITCGVS